MKSKLILFAAAAFAVGFTAACVGNGGDSPVQVQGTFATDKACTITTQIQRFGASFDLAGARQLGANGAGFADVLVVVQMTSEFSAARTSANGQVLSDQSRNGVYIDQVQLSYRSTPAITFEAETNPMHAYVEPGGTLNAVTDLLGTKAAQKMLDTLDTNSPVHDVIATVRFRGYTAGSSGATFTTNDIEFPIRVYDSGLTCSAGPAFNGPCGSLTGQGGSSCFVDGGTP